MGSGRRNRVVISCVTFETVKITDPILHYQATHVHLIRYAKDPSSEDGRMYREFYDRVCELITERSPFKVEIYEHNEKVSDFAVMLRTVLAIIHDEKKRSADSDIYVNVSAGTSEYAAAAAIASMMVPGTIPFSVSTERYTVRGENVRKAYYKGGKPVGLTEEAKEPRVMPSYSIDIPDKHLVLALRLLHERNRNKMTVTGSKMIAALKEKDLWLRGEMIIDDSDRTRKTDEQRSEAVYYQRDFVDKWLKYGWVRKNELSKRYEVTEDGEKILDTFYTKD
ncbi:MAG: DUF6293 family protein [Methanomassiliicoccaceae archaeon]|nr:DUF6293 family protein [Methanomassiliicoccaceae archaeon]